MKPVRARLAALLASGILAGLSSLGVQGLSPETGEQLAVWVNHTFELALLIGYAIIHPWLEGRSKATATPGPEPAHHR